MFRFAELTHDEGKETYRYMSAAASQTIIDAIEDMISPLERLETFSDIIFGGEDWEEYFFSGISQYIPFSCVRTEIINLAEQGGWYGTDAESADAMIGMEILLRKFTRMKEKMADPDQFYTFDLFEEYLFANMIDVNFTGEMIDDDEPFELPDKLQKKIDDMTEIIDREYGEYTEDPRAMAESLYLIENMGMGEDDLFFWDDDYSIFFQNTFIEGIRMMIGGMGSVLGYDYDSVCEIFTDAGFTVPLMLTGTEAAFTIREDLTREKMKQVPEFLLDKGQSMEKPDWKKMFPDLDEDEELPFS
jgi:hypothetical protein